MGAGRQRGVKGYANFGRSRRGPGLLGTLDAAGTAGYFAFVNRLANDLAVALETLSTQLP